MNEEAQIPLRCELCSKDFSGVIPAQQHFISEAHRKKADLTKNSIFKPNTQPYWCDPCNIQCNSPEQFAQHINSPRHHEIVKRTLTIPKRGVPVFHPEMPTVSMNRAVIVNREQPMPAVSESKKEYDFQGDRGYCYICSIDLTSSAHARQHLSGSKHQKKKKQTDSDYSGLFCTICKVPFSCPKNAQEHLASAKHQKRKMELEQQEQFSNGTVMNIQPPGLRESVLQQTHVLNMLPSGLTQPVQHQTPFIYQQNFQSSPLADVPIYSDRSMASVPKSTPLTSSISLLEPSVTSGIIESTRSLITDKSVPYTFDGKQGYCNICRVDLTSPQNAKQHLEGSKHQKAEKLWKERSVDKFQNKCDMCNVVFSGPESARQHFESDRHKKKSELPVTNFTISEQVKPELSQKVNMATLASPTSSMNVQRTLPLNIQPDPTMQITQQLADLSFKLKKHELNQPMPNLEQATSENQNSPGGLGLSVSGGGLPTPLEIGTYSQLFNLNSPSFVTQEPVQRYDIQNVRNNQTPNPVTVTQKANAEEEPEYRFDGSRGWCNVCSIELTSKQHADQHLSGRNHAKASTRWKSSFQSPAIPVAASTNVSQVKISVTKEPYRFDGNRGWCNVCSIELTSLQHAYQHISGQNHTQNQARWDASTNPGICDKDSQASDQPYEFDGNRGFCNVCKVALTSRAHAEQHLSGKPHEKALFRWQSPMGFSPTKEDVYKDDGQATDAEEPTYVFTGSRGRCFVCNIELTSREHANQHLQGRNHSRAVERRKMATQTGLLPLECKMCLKSFSGQESASQHFASAKHKSKAMISSGGIANSNLDQSALIADGQRSPAILANRMSPSTVYMCEVCRCPLNSFEQLSIHKQSPNHLKTVEKMNRFVAVNLAVGDNGNDEAGSNVVFDPHALQKEDEHMDLWNALKNGEITTVKGVVVNTEQGAGNVEGSKSGVTGYTPFSVVTDTGQSQDSSTKIISTNQSLNSNSNTGESSGSYHTASIGSTDLSPRRNSSGFHPYVGVPIGSSSGGQAGIRANPGITTDTFPLTLGTDSGPGMTPTDLESDDYGTSDNGALGLATKPAAYNPLKNRNRTSAGNKYTIGSLEDQDSDESPRLMAPRVDIVDDNDSVLSFASDASSFLNKGAHASLPSITTDNNPSVNVQHLPTGELASICEEGSTGFPSSNAELLSDLAVVGPLPNKAPTNPYKGFFKFYCEICMRPMNTKKDFEIHLESRSHKQRAAVVEAPKRDLGQIKRRLGIDKAEEEAYTVTKTCPRSYQVELFCKTMEDDRVIFLPTGTGKTLVSVMTMSCMLRLNPKRPVLFLVDKVLLVLQQSKYILKELGEKHYKRLPLDGSYPELKERPLKIATLCGNLLPEDHTPLYRHDVVVATAAYVDNLLQKRFIHWTDFSLVVFDEAHHCVKSHPFNRLLKEYHRPCPPEYRPKVLGLTASPAGRDSVENTYNMLQELFANLGGARVAIVQRESEVEDLARYQSSAKLEIKYIPYSEEEKRFRTKLLEYLCHCYLKLWEITNLESECGWNIKLLKGHMSDFVANLDNAATNKLMSVLDTLKPISEEKKVKAEVIFLSTHLKVLLLALSDMDGCGIPTAIADLSTLTSPQQGIGFNHAELLGLPTEPLKKEIQNSSHATQIHNEFEESVVDISLYTQLLKTLTDTKYINWSSENSMALILVRERAHAHRLSNFLKQSLLTAENNLNVTAVVGHGSGSSDGGMKVKQQKQVLDGVRRKKYNIIVATSVAEEGVDIPECELVVCMNPPSTVTGLVQMRGRARKKGSFFIILCKDQEEENKMKNLLRREHYMMKAAKLCIQNETV